jgi:hypothetical protein
MSNPETILATQLANIEKRTGKSLAALAKIIKASGLTKHGEIREMLKRELGIGHGDANALVHHVLKPAGPDALPSIDESVSALYAGPKAALRPIHDELMARIKTFGEFELAPKKTYVSLRRKKQFAMIGPATNTRVEVGLNLKGIQATARLVAMPPKGMCDYKVKLTDVAEVDAELLNWVRRAYDGAGYDV